MDVKYRKGMKVKIKRNIKNILKEFPPSKYPCVIDVGTKEGYAVDWFRKFGYNAVGVESEKGYARDNILEGNFLEMKLLKDLCDIVFSRHSLEHIALENDNGTERFLKTAYEMLWPGGILYIIVPIRQWAEFELKKNLNIFNSFGKLTTFIRHHGFKIIKSRCRENALFIARKK